MLNSSLTSIAGRLRALLPARFRAKAPRVAVVRLTGVIGAAMPFRQGLSMSVCGTALERAFGLPRVKAVAIVVNSPGGSPVQSHLIFSRIRALSEEKKVPVIVFAEDVAASGGYMIACAGDEIFADPSSLVGSIGVVSAGFGFDRLIERFGIERRVHTQGQRKAMLDPFRPEQPEDLTRLKEIQEGVQTMFVDLVRARRGERLKGDADTLFSGAVWIGGEAVGLGLIDGLGDLRTVMRRRYGDTVELRPIALARPGFLRRVFSRPEPSIGGLIDPGAALAALEERAAWARFGL